jgi:hypothetical protein
MAVLVKPEVPETTVTLANGERFTLKELQDLVGGYIEIVHLRQQPKGQSYPIMAVDEDGGLVVASLCDC